MTARVCFICGEARPATGFTVDTCGPCTERDRRSATRAAPVVRPADLTRTQRSRRDRAKNPDKYRARNAVSNALRDGRLAKKPCEGCGEQRVQGHHDDYSRPLEVRWLCARCHTAAHAFRP